MDIRNVANQSNVDRSSDRSKRADARTVVIPTVARDEASISATGRETAAAIAGLAERARNSGGDRGVLVARAMEKLVNGELDNEATVASTARRMLDAKFLSV